MAPNAPIGAAHITMDRMRKTSRWMCSMPRSTGCPAEPMAWSANPASRATSSVWSTWPSVKAETNVVGMIDRTKSTGGSASGDTWSCPVALMALVMCSPSPGCSTLPTTSPMASATSDITRK